MTLFPCGARLPLTSKGAAADGHLKAELTQESLLHEGVPN